MVLGLEDWIIIFLAAGVFSLIVNFANRILGIRKRTNELQKQVNAYQKEYQEAVKKNDETEMARLKKREPEVMKMMQEMLFLPFKNMIVVIPMFLIVIWMVGSALPNFVIDLPIALHLNGNELLGLNVFQSSTYGSRGFFILSSVISGLVIEGIAGKLLKQ
ncbi:DUF106 domain-containing protein [Candidatus Micrarchaeota archaeon]|nr:DUF106 domain-containing protein [Candidatus Micrarchaeota archaeon]